MDFTSLCQFRQLIKGTIISGNWIMLSSKRPFQIISFIEKQHLTEKRREKKVFWMTFNDFIWARDLEILIQAYWIQINVLFGFYLFFSSFLNGLFSGTFKQSLHSLLFFIGKEWKLFLRQRYWVLKMIKSGQSMFVVSFCIATKNKSFRRTFL